MKTKLRLFKAVVLPTLLYGSETWVPLAPHVKRLQAFIMGCLQVILGVSQWDKMRNTELRSEVKVGHVQRMEGCRLPKCLLVCKPAMGRRSVGGQKRDGMIW